MKPPYEITPGIVKLIASISEQIGKVKAVFLDKPAPHLRKQNRIKTIHSSLKIEGNVLTEDQITALLENKRVIGPKKDVTEVLNAIQAYENIASFNPFSERSFLNAHRKLMNGLVENAGKYRTQGVGIFQGSKITHIAPPAMNVPLLMTDLFKYLKNRDELTLIKSCVFHYETEFIHPFMDGNGRMGRLWQTVILLNEYPVFEFLPFETLISQTQDKYYEALAESDKAGKSTVFIEYMLTMIHRSFGDLLDYNQRIMSDSERLEYFCSLEMKEFTRKDYMNVFKSISSATASRDLKKGLEMKIFEKTGDKNLTLYKLLK